MIDTIFNEEMRPVFSDEPETVKRRLKAGFPDTWKKVLVGSTGLPVSIPEYLYEDKFNDVLRMIQDLIRRQDLAVYKRNPDRMKIYLEASAKKIIERVLED